MSTSRLVLFLLLTAALAAQSDPVLVIDPQRHSALIRDIAFTSDGARHPNVQKPSTIGRFPVFQVK